MVFEWWMNYDKGIASVENHWLWQTSRNVYLSCKKITVRMDRSIIKIKYSSGICINDDSYPQFAIWHPILALVPVDSDGIYRWIGEGTLERYEMVSLMAKSIIHHPWSQSNQCSFTFQGSIPLNGYELSFVSYAVPAVIPLFTPLIIQHAFT